jgi:cephalosporin-C deacetylase-like acetyl esterase
MRRDVEFAGHGGVTLRGWLYTPAAVSAGRATVPGIVMAHGFSATKEMALDAFAGVFCDAGLAVLVYDHRNLGASDGEPRGLINPWAQARDYRVAIDWLAARPEVDAERIGVWGSSYSGGHVLVVGAIDERVRAVVANVPFAGLSSDDYEADTTARFAAMRAALEDASGNGPADRDDDAVGPLAVVNEAGVDVPVFLGDDDSSTWFLGLRSAAPTWRNEVFLHRAAADEPPYDPGVAVANLHQPVLFVVATDDRVAPTQVALASFERAPEPKQLDLIEGHHFTQYSGEGFALAAKAAKDFFLRWL